MTYYVGDTETDGLLKEATKFHCLVFSPLDMDTFYVFCDINELSESKLECFKDIYNIRFFSLEKYIDLLNSNKTEGLIIHNIYGFDLPVMNKLDGVNFKYNLINNKKIEIIDTLAWSRNLNPERQLPKGCPTSIPIKGQRKSKKITPHGLEAWGYKTGIKKPEIEDWTSQSLDTYVHRCIEDVRINKAVYHLLKKESEDVAIPNGKQKGDWDKPLQMGLKIYYLMTKQERDGVLFDQKKAYEVLDKIDTQMKEIEDEINPLLGERELPKTQQPDFPKRRFKKDGGLTSYSINYAKKFGITDYDEAYKLINECSYDESKCPRLKEKMTLEHKAEVKAFLYEQGWEPIFWKNRNIIIDPKTKKENSKKKKEDGAKRYIKELVESPYKKDWLKELGYKKEPDFHSEAFFKKVLKKGRNLISSPQFKDDRGELCPNLVKLQGDSAKKIVTWLTLSHRRSMILNKDGDKGWLTNPRLKEDGKLSAGHTGLTNTFRKKHKEIVNVPKPKDHVLFGKELRSLFIAPEGYYNVGADAASLESMVASHYTIPFDGGEYAQGVIDGTFHDKNAERYSEIAGKEINRDDGKNCSYAVLYGVQKQKLASMMSVTQDVAQKMIEEFWKKNIGLGKVKEALEAYWEKTGQKYIMGLDGRKVFTRSRHSIMNTLFQSAGAIIFDFADCYLDTQMERQGVDGYIWGRFHDEIQAYHKKEYVKGYWFDEEPEEERDGFLYSEPLQKGDKWLQYYSEVGHQFDQGFIKASEYFNTNVTFRASYLVGRSWAECH